MFTKKSSLFFLTYFCCVILSTLSQSVLEKAKIAYEKGDFNRTIDLLSKENFEKYESAEFADLLINSYLNTNKYKEAIEIALKAKSKFKSIKESQKYDLILASSYASIGKYKEALEFIKEYLNNFPRDEQAKKLGANIYAKLALDKYKQKKYLEALSLARLAISLNPNELNYYHLIAQIHFEFKDPNEANYDLNNIYVENFADVDYWRSKVILFFVSNRVKEAIPLLEQIIKQNPYDKSAILSLGLAYRYDNKIERAINLYKQSIAKFPKDTVFYAELLQFCDLINYYDVSLETLDLMEKEFPSDSIEIKFQKVDIYVKKGDKKNSRNILLSLMTYPEYLCRASLNLSELYLVDNDTIAAIKTLKDSYHTLENQKEKIIVLSRLLKIYIFAGDYEKIKEVCSLLLSMNEKDFEANFYLAFSYYNLGDYVNAKVFFEKAAALNQEDPRAKFYLSEIIFNEDKLLSFKLLSEAIESLIERLDALNLKLQNIFGQYDLKALSKEKEKIEIYQREFFENKRLLELSFEKLRLNLPPEKYENYLLELSRKNNQAAYAYFYLAKYYYSKNELDKSETYLIRTLTINPRIYEAHLTLGYIYESKSDYAKAETFYAKAIAIEKDKPEAYDGIIRIRKKNNRIKELAEEWMRAYEINKGTKTFQEKLIETLHLVGDHKNAAKIIYMQNNN